VINNGDPENHLDIVQLLINSGVDLNAFDDYRQTALMLGRF
jgi:ankyrin repeat protein